jgi:hypothetical protein
MKLSDQKSKNVIRIANAGGYWGDDPYALRRLLNGPLELNYISIDYLAEITMSILQKQRIKDPQSGFARDFVTQIEPLLEMILQKKVRIITNAGGVNPRGCAEALFAVAKAKGLDLKIAVIDGDNIADRVTLLMSQGVSFTNMETGEEFDKYADKLLSANSYFGAKPVVAALACEPDIVLCGRVTDTGITLGAMIHEFGWSENDYDKLAAGIVGGHIIECGAQATGGNFTDWRKVPSFVDMGFPILECSADGSFVVTKQPGSGGLVSLQTIREQLLYEMGHPQSYIVPDVIADFTTIALEADGANRVKVSGVKGRPPTDLLKVSMAYSDGFKSTGTLIISGPDALEKAEVFGKVFWQRLESELALIGCSSIEAAHTEYIGHNSTHHALTPPHHPSEILLRLSARDHSKEKLAVFRKLLPSMILSGPSGVAVTGGAPTVSDVVAYWPALIPQELSLPTVKSFVLKSKTGEVALSKELKDIAWPQTKGSIEVHEGPLDPHVFAAPQQQGEMVKVSLMNIAHARSGDKGDTVNIGLIARSTACYAWIRDNITADKVKNWFAGAALGKVTRCDVPNLWSLNFLLEESLGGGGTLSLFIDAQGKTFSQALLRCEVLVPLALLKTIAPENAPCQGELLKKGGV